MKKCDIVKLANSKHNSYYNYLDIKDSGTMDKINIICPIHSEFNQRLDVHLKGSGCPKCANDKKRHNIYNLIIKFNEIHNNKYDYSLVKYVNNYTKIKIICNEHGIFEQTPSKHLRGSMCKKCANNLSKEKRKKTQEQFIFESKELHNNKYGYSLVKYINNYTKIKIICNEHGIFEQTPNNHLNGQGCFVCAHININNNNLLNENVVIDKCNTQHNNKYDYSLFEYIRNDIKSKIVCNIHGVFEQTPSSHINGSGCPYCSIIKNRIKYLEVLKYRLKQNIQITPNFSVSACESMDLIMKEKKSNIQHAMNGGEFYIKELGYWVDGYDIENNIVYEFDESYHFDKHGDLRNKDKIRQIEIEKFLKCNFIRIKK